MAVVSGVIGSLLRKLGDLLKEEYGLQKGVKKKIENLARELREVYAVLHKIGDVPWDQLDEQVRLWASELREASYDMEDIVDTFLVHVDAPEPTTETHKLRRLRKKVSSLFKKTIARRNISSQIKEIYKKLEELAGRRDRYKTPDSIVTEPATTIDPRIMNLFKTARELVGIDGPKDKLIDMLSIGDDSSDMPENKKMKIVSVVGFGGLGKTTLAKVVYDQLRLHFKWGAFIPVGRNPDIKKVLRDILIGLDKEKFVNFMNLAMLDVKQLMDELKESIMEKRCFIVIDDIWDMETWKLIRCVLQESNSGSRLVITTRIFEVASYAGEAYKMQPLSHDKSKKLLYARIADGEGKYFDSPSAEACERILKKCNGVPLAIITIASLLASKPGEDWSVVYNSIGFGHKGNSDVDNTRKILSFSYYDLPSHLKTCLLYLSIFPEDHVIEKNRLIWKWVAEGFVAQEEAEPGVGLFELGERYFNELINRSLIQPRETHYEGYVDACSVHDMVLDLILQLSREQNFVSILNVGEQQKLQGSISRRVALRSVEEHNVGQLANIAMDKVRSIFASDCDFSALWPRLPFLRVVETLECSVFDKDCGEEEIQSEDYIASLPHLRYLELAYTSAAFSRSIRCLRFLQTLDLEKGDILEVPEEMALLTQLVCLRLNTSCEGSVPAGLIGKLTSLQELSIGVVHKPDAMQFVKDLGLLTELRVLNTCIDDGSDDIVSTLLESLGHLHNIQELQILNFGSEDWVSGDAGRLPCRHLRFLYLGYFVFSGLAAWINSSLAPNLSYLDVKLVVVKDQDMEILAKLPELICLKLHSKSDTKSVVSIKIRTYEGVGYFRKLRFLKIDGPSLLFDLRGSECKSNRVVSSNTIMPSLESLEFDVHVQSLKDENLQFGFDELLGGFQNLGTNSLQRVKIIVNCRHASTWDVEEAEGALKHVAAVHPKYPTLKTYRVEQHEMISRYQEACMEMSRAPELVTKAWKLVDIVGLEHIQILHMPDKEASSSKVMRLLYTDIGMTLLALSSNAIHKLWKWEHSGKSAKSIPPVFWQPENGVQMTNHTINGNKPEEATACFALSRDESKLFSASGGKVSFFDMETFKVFRDFMAPPTAATFLALDPRDNGIIAIGMEDSSVHICYYFTGQVYFVLRGHQKKITGLAFSKSKNVLVSSSADAQPSYSDDYVWEKKKSRYVQPPSNLSNALIGDTWVQFHYDETHLLVVLGSQLAIYDWQLECLCSWFPRDALPAPISSAVYSLGCLLVYAGFRDGAIGIFEAESLTLQSRIAPSAYIPSPISSGETVYPTVVATHPLKPNQIAVGMSDGAVLVLEPLDTDDIEVASNPETEQCPPSDVSNSGSHS